MVQKIKFDLIVNCDETPLYFEMIENNTINFAGEKNIIIKTNGGEKKRITYLLAITARGKKLKPLLIFKGVEDDLIEKNQKQYRRYIIDLFMH